MGKAIDQININGLELRPPGCINNLIGLFQALDAVNEDNFDTTVYIRNQGHSVMEAINRQLAHYSYHVGQIILLGKIIKGDQWQSLSIPKGQSKQYNQSKFSQPKSKKHFTDEFLSNPPEDE